MAVAKVLAEVAKAAAKDGKNIVKIIEAAGTIVGAANILMEQAKPLVGEVDPNGIANGLKAGAQGVAAGAGKAGGAIAGAAGDALGRAGALLAKVGDAKDGIIDSFAQIKSQKELEKAIKDARQSVLENSTMTITAADLTKAKEKAGEAGIGPLNTMPGCFVIATYKKLDFDKDLTDYINLYIGKADNVADGVDSAMSRDGDPDVYADIKYGQNVHIYVYNCLPEEVDSLLESLSQTFADGHDENNASRDDALVSNTASSSV